MAVIRIDIMDLKDLIRLKQKDLSNRKAATMLNVSRNTINSYVRLIEAQGLNYKGLLKLSDSDNMDSLPTECRLMAIAM